MYHIYTVVPLFSVTSVLLRYKIYLTWLTCADIRIGINIQFAYFLVLCEVREAMKVQHEALSFGFGIVVHRDTYETCCTGRTE